MRPETSAATLTNFFGLTSPEALTVETRSRRATFSVCTATRLRPSLVTLKATIPPTTTTAAAPAMIRVLFDAAILRPLLAAGPHGALPRRPRPAQDSEYVRARSTSQGNLAGPVT